MQKISFKSLGALPGCADMHVTRLKSSQVTVAHTHDFYEVFLVLEGKGIHHLNRRKIPLQAGDLAVIRPSDAHWYSTATNDSLAFVNAAVSAAWWEAWHTLLGLAEWLDDKQTMYLSPVDAKRFAAELSRNDLTYDPLSIVQAWEMVRKAFIQPSVAPINQPPAWLQDLRLSFAKSPDDLLQPVAYWQRRSGRSPEHLARSCRRFYGVTLSELINQARIERACYLLRTTDDKIITIAIDCGFENMAHFHRVFARQTGQTPGKLRLAATSAVPTLFR